MTGLRRHKLVPTLVVGLTIAALGAPPVAAAEETAGVCVGGAFTSTPKPGTRVAPGSLIVYHLDVVIEGGSSVLGCSRDITLSPLVEWVSSSAGSLPGITGVHFVGPFAPGTHLSGDVTVRVRRKAPIGATIEASSADVIRHTVGQCNHPRNGKVTCRKPHPVTGSNRPR
jgi:hypothetical protein